MKETKALIEKKMKNLLAYISSLKRVDDDPEVVRLRRELESALKRVRDNARPKIDEAYDRYRELEQKLLKLKEEKEGKIPEKILTFLSDCKSGVDWGSKPFNVSWVSPNGRFFIVTNPGSTFWASMHAPRKYAPSKHYLMDMEKHKYDRNSFHGYDIFHESKVGEVEGRLTKEQKQEWINMALAKEGNVK